MEEPMADRFDEIHKRWRLTTPGPWTRARRLEARFAVRARGEDVGVGLREADAEAVAAAPEDVAWLLDEVRHLRSINKRLRAQLGLEEETVGKSRQGDTTLATFKIEKPTDD